MDRTDITPEELAKLLAANSGVPVEPDQLNGTTTFDDLGVESLALLGVITSIERSRAIALPTEAQEIESVQEFLNLLNESLRKEA